LEFLVLRLRYRGRPLPKSELANRAPAAGDLRVEQCFDETLNRHLRLARLIDPRRPREPDQLPALYDPALVAMSPQAFTLAGFERIDGVDFAQSWLVRGDR
jgi:hypothetical protein